MSPHRQRRAGFFSGIGFRFGLLLALVLLLSVGGLAWRLAEIQRENLVREATHGAERFSDALVLAARQAMLRNQREDLQAMISSVAAASGIQAVRIHNKSGVVTYSARPEEIGHQVNLEAEACIICHRAGAPLTNPERQDRTRIFSSPGGTRLIGYITPIRNEPGCSAAPCHAHSRDQKILGVIDLQVSLEEIDAAAERDRNRFLTFLTAWILILAVAAAYAVHRFVTRPIRSLAVACRDISEPSSAQTVPTLAPAVMIDLEELGASFNTMARHVAEAQEGLERKVVERTRRLRDAEDQIIRSEKLAAMGVMAAGIAHELNNPLTGIVTFSHVLLRDIPPDSPAATRLKRIIEEAERSARIVQGLLDYARPLPRDGRPVGLHPLIENTITLLEPQKTFQEVRFERRFAPELDTAKLSSSALQQVLINVAKNAAEAGARTIAIRTGSIRSDEGEHYSIAIEDDGGGIPPENLPRIFDPFYTTKDVGHGSGLGLWISYRIITELRGTITAVNRQEGGSRFEILLPVANSDK